MSCTLPYPVLRGVTSQQAQRAAGIKQSIADRLLAEGRIDGDQHRRAIELAVSRRTRVEEALLELGILGEPELLRYVANLHKTRFVSMEKLSKASISARILDLCSTRTAELHGVFPVLFDERTGTLSVVTADPDDERALEEVKTATPAIREIEALVARPAAVRAAISFHYRGDRAAFRALLPAPNVFEAEGRIPCLALVEACSTRSTPPPASERRTAAPVTPPAPTRLRASVPPVPRLPPPPALPSGTAGVAAPCPEAASVHFIETLRTLVTFLERGRGDLGGHSPAVARIVRQICEDMGVDRDRTAALVVAAHLHDLGKGDGAHLTALDVAKDEALGDTARQCLEQPVQIGASLDLVPETEAAITGMYERWDGRGLPQGRPGKDIPLGARILAAADTYADLTQNPGNRYRRILRPFEACAVLLKYGGSVFDPDVVDALRRAMMGTDELPAVLRA